MNEVDRSSLTTFFTHTQNICYFLQAQVWQEETDMTINRLSATSSQVSLNLHLIACICLYVIFLFIFLLLRYLFTTQKYLYYLDIFLLLTNLFTTQKSVYYIEINLLHRNLFTIQKSLNLQVAEQLEQSEQVQRDILQSQNQSLHTQHQLLVQTHNLSSIINISSQSVRLLFEDLKVCSSNQLERENPKKLY